MTKVNEVKEKNGMILQIALTPEDMKAMDTRDRSGHYEAVEITPQKGTMFAKVRFILQPSTTPGAKPNPVAVIDKIITSIVIGKLHAKELRLLKEAEVTKAEQETLENMNAADRKRAEKMKNLSPCCEARMIHQDKTPPGIMMCTKCETNYRKIGAVWISADTETSK